MQPHSLVALALLAHPGVHPPSAARRLPAAGTTVRPDTTAAVTVPPEVYAIAIEKLLAHATGATGDAVVLLPTSAGGDVALRARRASGPAIPASAATARSVASLLGRRGLPGVHSAAALDPAGGMLQLVLGELRYEPAVSPRFARLKIGVVGAGAARATAEVLLKREAAGWRTLNVRTASRPTGRS
jgi:hypothetical protein